jgi:hypothetical protein
MPWIKISEAVARLDGAVSNQHIRRLLERGILLGTDLAGVKLVDSRSLDDLIERGKVAILVRPRKGQRAAGRPKRA